MYVTELFQNDSTDFYETFCVFLSESLDSLYLQLVPADPP